MTGDIAVVGLSTRFPGAANVEEYWSLIRDGRSGLTRLTTDELLARGVPAAMVRDRNYVPVAGIIEGQSHFDPAAWGFTDAEASALDPQHRMLMECAWLALEDSGHGHGRNAGAVGVFVGSTQSGYLVHNLAGRWDSTGGGRDPLGSMQTAIATQPDYLPLQIAYRLGLTGPAIAVSTSCSTSLVAIHLAAQSLLSGECDTALAGGVSAIVPQGRGYLYVEGGVFSRDGEIAPFGARGSGIVYSQGAGAVVLRRLDDAIADGDPILAVLHGSAVNNDGKDKAGFTAPSVRGQARVVAEALAVADAAPSDIGLIEAHGTATRLGDPIEIAALRAVFGQGGPPWCGIGSVKGNIGHTNSAAGIASFAKAVLAIHHRTLPVSLGSDAVADGLRLDESPFELLGKTREWDTAPLAGVSSFGIGGTNAHLVLGPAPVTTVQPTPFERPVLLISSGATPGGARATADAIADFAARTSLPDLAHTLAVGRAQLGHRTAAVLAPAEPTARPSFFEPVVVAASTPSVIFAFPGAGGHYRGMGADLYRDEPVFRGVVDEVAELLVPHIGADVRDIFDRNDTSDRIRDVAFAVPALFAISLGMARLLQSWGLTPAATLGHSLGECTAAAFTGALTLTDACTLVAARCTAAARSAGVGGMMSVALSEDALRDILADHPALDMAAVNGPNSCVIAGTYAELRSLEQSLTDRGADFSMLRLKAAMHSRHVEPALGDVEQAVRSFDEPLDPARIGPVYSTVTGSLVDDAALRGPSHWVDQLRNPVQFSRALTAAVGSTGNDVVILEVGPGSALTGLALAHGFANAAAILPTMTRDEPESVTVRAAVGRAWAVGVDVDLTAVSGGTAVSGHTAVDAVRRLVCAPGYSFDRRHLWIEPADADTLPSDGADDPLQIALWRQLPPADATASLEGTWAVVGTGSAAEALRRQFAQHEVDVHAGETEGELHGVVYFGSEYAGPAAAVTAFAETAAHLVPSTADDALWLLVTRNGSRSTGSSPVDPASAAVRALPQILCQESPGLRWAAVDVDSDIDADDCADVVFGEIVDAVGRSATRPASDVTVRSGERWESILTSWSAGETAATAVLPGTKALIVGGSGAVGRLIGRHLAGLGYDVVSTSRRERSESGPAAHAIRHVVGDATDAADLASVVTSLDSEAGPIGLVVHAAGLAAVLAPVTLTSAGHDAEFGEAARAHMDAKLTVAQNIHRGISGLPEGRRPAAVLCMSSATGVLGGIGMGPYAASNTAMDAYVTSLSSHRVRWVSIVWDGWRADLDDVGSDSANAMSAIAMSGALDAETGLTALDRIADLALAGRSPAVVAVGTSGLGPRSRAASIPRQRAAAGATLSGLTDTQQGVAEMWSEMFGAAITDPGADFFALGGHSLLGTRMLDSVRQRFGVELGLRELLTAATLAQFSGRIDAARSLPAPSNVNTAVPPLSDVLRDDGTFVMTRVQHAYWIGRSGGYAWGEVPCHFYLEYDCADLDLERYNRALDAVIARHPMLRTVATPDGRLRTLDSVPPYRIRTRELTTADDESRERTLETIRRRVAEKPGPPDRWPLVQIEAARTDSDCTRLFIGVDVLICDAASWWIIESELKALYEHPETPLPALDLHPAQCSSAMAQRRRGPGGVRAERYWLARAESVPGPPRLPIQPGFDGRPRFVRRATSLRPEQWSRFVTECRRHRITPTAALLTLYTDSLRAWSTTQHFSVVLTLFDRPPFHPDVNKVVGDFTSLILHESGPDSASSFVDRAQVTQRRMFDDLDHREYTALELLAEQSRRCGEHRSVPVVFTGALGVHDMVDDSGSLEWVGTQVHAVGQTPQTWLDHQVLEQDGELRLQWDVVDGLFPDDELAHLVARHTEAATKLADDASAWTLARHHGAVPQIDPADVLVPLRGSKATAGQGGPTLFLVHPSGGDVLCYAELSRRLTTEVAVVALTDPQLTVDTIGRDSIEDIAAQYVSALRSQYPTPPGGWLLGGWSMGGSLAQEMARQLQADGEHTALIVMLDSNDPTYITAIDGTAARVELEVARRQLGAVESFLDIDLDIGDAAWKEIAELDPDARNSVIAAKLRSRKLLGPRDDGLSRREVFGRHLAALAQHTPRLHSDADTETLLVRCTRLAPNNSGIGMGIDDTPAEFSVDLGWSRHLAGRLTVVVADAHHYSMLREPALDDVVGHLDRALRMVLDRP